jgi:hypothetical protein
MPRWRCPARINARGKAAKKKSRGAFGRRGFLTCSLSPFFSALVLFLAAGEPLESKHNEKL